LLSKSLKCAFFVGAISAGLVQIKEAHPIRINEGIKQQWTASAHYAPAISSEVSWGAGKSVGVASPSPQIEKSPTALNVQDILWRERWMLQMRGLATGTKHFWPQHTRTGWNIWVNLIEVEIGRDWHIAKKAVCVNLQSLSRSFPTIVPNRTNAPIKMSGSDIRLIQWLLSTRKNEGSFIGNKSFSSELGLSAGGHPQSTGEGSNYNGAERSYSRAVVLNELSRTADISRDNGSVTGWLIYAALKERRG
jgi:hypothetical protein